MGTVADREHKKASILFKVASDGYAPLIAVICVVQYRTTLQAFRAGTPPVDSTLLEIRDHIVQLAE